MACNISLFDLFPVELVHTLFTYFWSHEIVYSFFNINDHINDIILSYSSHQINFKSIIKCHFDILCRLIRPDQLISLTLSDDNDTPNQSKLFFSHFHVEQFIRLRSFTLLDIEINSLKSILSKLNKLNQLRSLSIHCDNIVLQESSLWITSPMNSIVSTISSEVLLQLNRLNLGVEINVEGSILPVHLRYLTIATCTVKNLEMILSEMSQLILLNVYLQGDVSNIGQIHTFSSLRWLKLRKTDSSITMDQIERFLSNLPHLTHLELDIKGQIDLVDGYQWQILTNNFITFNFKFNVELHRVESILDSFRTPFWVSNKCWYVAYDNECLFTVPHFIPKHVTVPYYSPTSTTTPDDTLFYDHIKCVTIFEPRRSTLHRFRHLKELNIQCSISPKFFLFEVDLSRLEHLILSSLDNIRSFMLYLNAMPCLSKLSIKGYLTTDFIKDLKDYRTEQIRTLEIDTSTKNLSYIIEGLIRLFPRVERLYISTITLKKDMIRLIDGFQYLSNASFTIKSSLVKKDQSWFLKPDLSIHGVRRLKNSTFTCRYHPLAFANLVSNVHLWIEAQPQQPWWIKHLPPRRGYLWYRLMHILSWNFNLNKFIMQPSKHYLKCMIRGFGALIIIVGVLISFASLLCCIALFYNYPSIIHACYVALYLAFVFPNFYHWRSRILFSGFKICTNIFKFIDTYFNNRRLY